MELKRNPRPEWADKALQGLAFWVGHSHSIFPNHPLPEGALVAELWNLIQAHLPRQQVLLCERSYRTILPKGAEPKLLGRHDRADLVVATEAAGTVAREQNISQWVRCVIEVKRASARWSSILKDLRRLHEARVLTGGNAHCMLFVISEAKRPVKYIGDDGGAIKKGGRLYKDKGGKYFVRRACKAAAQFCNKGTAHYACLLEVFP